MSPVADLADVLAFESGAHEHVVVNILGDRGIDSLQIVPLP
jgi:hypothetical protein